MVHKFVANRYESLREDGRRVTMQQILCQEMRCQLPKGHSATTAYHHVTCHACLRFMLDDFIRKASFCKHMLKTTKEVKAEGFRFPKLARGKKEFRFEPDPEILERLKY